VTANEWRIGMHVSFACGWLRQEENQYLRCVLLFLCCPTTFLISVAFLPSVPLEIAKTLDPSVQELLGYSLTDYALGYASPPSSNMPHPDLFKTHEAAPLGSECVAGCFLPRIKTANTALFCRLYSTLAPEVLLGRQPREWGASAGARKDSSLVDHQVIVAVYEDTEDGEKKLKDVKKSAAGEARL
jgi:hypothetical protein